MKFFQGGMVRVRHFVVAVCLGLGGAGCGENATLPIAEKIADQSGDLREILRAGLASGAKEVVIPPGRYRVKPQNRQHLLLAGLRDVTIVADGVEMICTETTRAITIENCENVTLRGLVIDYDPLPFTQGRITAISADGSRLEVGILDGYPEPTDKPGSVEIFDPATGRLRGRVTYFNTQCETTGPGTAVLIKSAKQTESTGEKVGDIAVIKSSHAPGGDMPHAIMATDNRNLTLENVTLYASNMFGFFENRCDGSKYLDCRVARRPAESDLRPRAHPRLRSLNADAYHSKNAAQGPVYERCAAHFMGDDAIAINGDFHFVTKSSNGVLRVLAKREMNMRVGDELQIFTFEGRRLENCRIVELVADGASTEGERAFLAERNMHDQLRKTGMTQASRITLDTPVEVPPGSLICSANRIGNGFAIRDCRVGDNRSRGLLVKAGRGEIAGNLIERSVMTAILISPEYWWMEAGLTDDLVISDNRIEEGEGMGIAVLAMGGDNALAPAGAFRNITVRGNAVKGGASPGLLLASIRGLVEEGNVVEPDPAKALFPWQVGPWGTGGVLPVMRVNVE